MFEIGFIGDFSTDTGPGIANRQFVQNMDKHKILVSKQRFKLLRVLEFFSFIIVCKQVCFCGFSNSLDFFTKICRLFAIDYSYICHGIAKYENKFIDTENNNEEIEKVVLQHSKIIFCVSETQKELLLQIYPDMNIRCEVIYNSIDLNDIQLGLNKDKHLIISTGGAMKQKNNLSVCKAIFELNKHGKNLKYIIIGSSKEELGEVMKYDFVTFTDAKSHEQVLEYMRRAYLYIQNSYFETFGISVVEALASGCNILITKNMGVQEIFKNIRDDDIIMNNNDICEIVRKINNVLDSKNYYRLVESMDRHLIDSRVNSERLYQILIS